MNNGQVEKTAGGKKGAIKPQALTPGSAPGRVRRGCRKPGLSAAGAFRGSRLSLAPLQGLSAPPPFPPGAAQPGAAPPASTSCPVPGRAELPTVPEPPLPRPRPPLTCPRPPSAAAPRRAARGAAAECPPAPSPAAGTPPPSWSPGRCRGGRRAGSCPGALSWGARSRPWRAARRRGGRRSWRRG